MIIYIHRNKINGKVYIGQTKLTIEKRSKKNGNGYKESYHFWNAINKFGWDNFDHAILEHCTKENADEREKYWINFFNATNSDFGYNMMVGGKTAKDETLYSIGVYCKETGQYFSSLSDAAEWGGLARTSMNDITKQIEGRRISAGKHPITQIPLHWCLKKEDINLPNKIRSSHNATAVIWLEEKEIFQSIKKASEKTSLSYQSIIKSCKSQGSTPITKKGQIYHWMYLSDYNEQGDNETICQQVVEK